MSQCADVVVRLTSSELKWLSRIAEERYRKNRKAGVLDRKGSPENAIMIERRGIFGEYAVCKYLKTFCPSFDTTPRSARAGSDHGDCLLPDGRKFDVKCCQYPLGNLWVSDSKKNTDIDLFILVTEDPGRAGSFKIRGYANRAEAIKSRRWNQTPCGWFYVVAQDELTPISKLRESLGARVASNKSRGRRSAG